jgi:hypothetical protein
MAGYLRDENRVSHARQLVVTRVTAGTVTLLIGSVQGECSSLHQFILSSCENLNSPRATGLLVYKAELAELHSSWAERVPGHT